MLTDKDINKLISVFPTKEEVRLIVREELVETKESLRRTLTAFDRLTKAIEDQTREYAAMSAQLTRHDKWIHKIAKHAGVALED